MWRQDSGREAKEFLEPSRHRGHVILEIVDNKIPFEDQSFDLVVSNRIHWIREILSR